MKGPERRPRRSRRHKLWPGTVITLVLLWVLLLFLLIHNGARLPRWPASAAPAPVPAAPAPAGQDFVTPPGS